MLSLVRCVLRFAIPTGAHFRTARCVAFVSQIRVEKRRQYNRTPTSLPRVEAQRRVVCASFHFLFIYF
jgi:hypothetical protein